MDFLSGKSYKSNCTEGGFEFQKQLMVYCCAKLRQMKCQKFSVGYEVDHFTKFDDVVCNFELNGKNYLIPMQSKFVLRDEIQITESDFLESTGRINLEKHVQGILKFLKDIQGKEVRFIIVTTSSLNVNMRNIRFKSARMEENQMILSISNLLIESGAKISQIDLQFRGFEGILNDLQRNLNIPRQKLQDIIDRLLFITQVPKEENFLHILKNLLNDVNVVNKETFFEAMQKRTTNSVRFEKATKTRKALNETTFEAFLRSSVLEADFQGISDSFLSEIELLVEFESQFLKESWEKLRNASKFIKCERNVNLNALRVLHSIKMTHEDAILVPISKLNDFHIECLKFYEENERTIVVLVDKEMQRNALVEKANIYYVGKIGGLSSSAEVPPFSYDKLTRKAKQEFDEKIIKVQDFQLKLKQIPNNESKEYKALMEKFFAIFCDKKTVKIGKKMPVNSHPYIERDFQKDSDPQNKMKVDIFRIYSRCIVKGQPGLGKSFTLKQMANLFKRNNSEYWVEFIELNLHGSYFGQKQEFTVKQAKDFLLDNFLSFQKDSSLDRELVEYYLTLECPPITLIFDGFDEIMPSYEEVVFNFIQKLVELKVKVVISGRPHSEKVLKELKNFEKIQICEYSNDQQKSFIQKYYEYKYKIESRQSTKQRPNEGSFSSFKKILDLMIINSNFKRKSKRFERFPLYLRMLSDIAFLMVENSENPQSILEENNHIGISWIFNEIFEISFKNYMREKERVDPTNNLAIQRSQRTKKDLKLFYSHVAVKEMRMEIVLPQLQKLTEAEILAQGFLRKLNDLMESTDADQFVFIHRTFAEYFLAEKLVENLESNIEKLQNTEDDDQLLALSDFLCTPIVNQIKENKILINIPNKDYEKREKFLKFFTFVTHYFFYYEFIEELEIIIRFLWKNFGLDGLKFFKIKETFWMNISHDWRIGEITDKLQLVDELEKKKYSDCRLFEEISRIFKTDLIQKMRINEDFETFIKVYKKVEKHWIASNDFFLLLLKLFANNCEWIMYDKTKNKIFWLIWKNYQFTNFTNFLPEIHDVPEHERDHIKTCEFLISTARKCRKCNMDITFEEFINDVCYVLSSDDFYKCLKIFGRNSFVYNQVLSNYTEIFKNDRQKFILYDNNSILYHFCTYKNEYQLLDFIRKIQPNLLGLLTRSPHFGGTSLEEYKRVAQRDNICHRYL